MNFRNHKFVVALATYLLLSSCSTSPKGVVVTTCISDPLTRSLHCVDRRGIDDEVDWADSSNYVCMPPDDYKELFEESRKR